MAEDARKLEFELLDMLDQQVAYTECRVDRNTVPNDLYVYDIRHSDDDDSAMREIAPYVLVNHKGTIICKEPITMSNGNYRNITDGDYGFAGGSVSLDEFVNGGW